MSDPNVMSACENVCRDFSAWFPDLIDTLANLATVFAAIFAIATFQSWKKQRILEQKQERAIRIILAAREVEEFAKLALTFETYISDDETIARKVAEANERFISYAKVARKQLEAAEYEYRLLGGESPQGATQLRSQLSVIETAFLYLNLPKGLDSDVKQHVDVVISKEPLGKIKCAVQEIESSLSAIVNLKDK